MKEILKENIALRIVSIVVVLATLITVTVLYFNQTNEYKRNIVNLSAKERNASRELTDLKKNLTQTSQELDDLKNQDQYLINQKLQEDIGNIEITYKTTVSAYEKLLKVREATTAKKTQKIDDFFSDALVFLSQQNYVAASAVLKQLSQELTKIEEELAQAATAGQNVAVVNTPPSSGYRRQNVKTDAGTFLIDIIVADLNSTKVIVDTASAGDCRNDCPVLSLAEFAQRSGAFAGINGPYFCPASYPNCSDKKNSFDTLLMNKDKTYFNSDNNVYSTVPAVIFSGNSARFVTQSLQWGRDIGVDAVIASQPLLVLNNEIVFFGDGEAKRASRGSRSFIGATRNTVYIGVVRTATVAEVAKVVKTLGITNALNLDSGGSTALWNGRYLAGPGRATPFGILLTRK
ncbi:MAG TPA: phosphodiester glycosidase family protein [Patescibacteria group bacterium]|nr:phosphodiester glycosidase family protein [Patescibacteria group bacterium]